MPNGTYTLQSLATDSAGNTTYSAGITVTVRQHPADDGRDRPVEQCNRQRDRCDARRLGQCGQSASTISKVQFVLTGGTYNKTVIGTATATIYGYVVLVEHDGRA